MLDVTSAPESSMDPRPIDDRTDAELDALPYGVIALDADGTILRYNLYESRFARLDRNQVFGRNFFAEVAPCTRTEAFEGRFRSFVAASTGGDARIERFDYLFDFSFGAQEVAVELSRAGNAARFYLFINRRKVAPPRIGVPRENLAARQASLAPDEARQGVLRDGLERRFIDVPAPFLAALRATCDRLAPGTWHLFSSEWGVQWGRRAAVELEASSLEGSGRSLRDITMREAATLVAGYLGERGWGALQFDFEHAAEGVIVVDIERSALAEAAPRRAAGEQDLTCHLVAGYLSGVLSSIADRRLAAREVACVAGGAMRCQVVVVSPERREIVDAALKIGVRGVEGVRAVLRRPHRPAPETQ